jgi:hypothetical protein
VAEFTLDTSGAVRLRRDKIRLNTLWSDLDPFTQGYVEALFASEIEDDIGAKVSFARLYGFSDLAPEALAIILADCAEFSANPIYRDVELTAEHGRLFWRLRQAGCPDFPPLTVSLGDDGKVRLS